ncbi:MAG TPA: sigma-70 family RNA polymerase sigma factor [Actinocrinis sp.]|nr:sigma-70 family RNA polymerase sigma factor [Actinocrinis sp.]
MRAAGRGEPAGPGVAPARVLGRPQVLSTAAYADWDAIYADNVIRVYRLMFAKVGNRPDAEDLTSQVFLKAFKPLRATASVGEVRAYLVATARTVLAAHWRDTLGHQVTQIDLDLVDLEDYADQARPAAGGEASAKVAWILGALSERHRAILTLRFLRGYSIRQAAAELGVTVANAKVLQHRALRFAAGLEPEGDAR